MPGSMPLDPLHAMHFLGLTVAQVREGWPADRPCRSDRECPLHTAGDRCLWHAGGTAGKNDDAPTWRRRLQLAGGRGPSSVTTASWARAQGTRGSYLATA
jgi:hypothetical protein